MNRSVVVVLLGLALVGTVCVAPPVPPEGEGASIDCQKADAFLTHGAIQQARSYQRKAEALYDAALAEDKDVSGLLPLLEGAGSFLYEAEARVDECDFRGARRKALTSVGLYRTAISALQALLGGHRRLPPNG